MLKNLSIIICICFILCACNSTKKAIKTLPSEYEMSIQNWQQQRVNSLTSPNGWLTLVGLYWLKEGINTMGSAATNSIILPNNAPKHLGSIELLTDSLYFRNLSRATQVNEAKFKEGQIFSDGDGEISTINYKSLFAYVIKRGPKYGLRLRDTSVAERYSLKKIPSFPINESWKKKARYIKPPKGTTIPITNAVGVTEENPVLGYLEFDHNNKTHRLTAIYGGPLQYFLIIADKTTSDQTYGGGRFIYVNKPDAEGYITIDFNKAYNPPCVFTDFATCPLPPKENILPFRIEAGEKNMEH